MAEDLESELLERRVVYEGRVLDLHVERVRLPHGGVADMEVVRHQGAAAVVPVLDDGRVVLIRQYRHVAGGEVLEIPAGGLEPGESPAECALRELGEEAGYRLTGGGDLTELGWIWTTPGFTDEKIWLFLARGLEPCDVARDPDEILEVEHLPFAEAVEKAASGEIHDGKTTCALLRAARRLQPTRA
jgi:ADP-ribose pyrophosphatase